MEMLTDNAISTNDEDLVDFHPFAQVLAECVLKTSKLPFCIGVFGEWGSGKSSLMNMIRNFLKGYEKIKSIWFNPWKYDKKEDLWGALIQTILYQILEEQKLDEGIRKKAIALVKATSWAMLKKGLSTVSAGIIEGKDIEEIKDKIDQQNKQYYQHMNHFEKDFEELVKNYTEDGKLVIFIDDLDRCLPENVITILESLKLFLGNANCVFVLGMDHYIVEEAIDYRFSKKVRMSGRDYLDKIIQVPFFLPQVPFEKLREALENTEIAQYNENVWELIRLGLGGNPRKTKRFVNCFFLLNTIIKKSPSYINSDKHTSISLNIETQNFYLAKLLVIQMVFTDFYSHLKLHPEDLEYFHLLATAETTDARDNLINKRPIIRSFWENEYLRNFMNKTAKTAFPNAPNEIVVESLLRAINLISENTLV